MLVTVFEQNLKRKFQAPVCSLAFCFSVAVLLGAVIIPFYVTFASRNFWLKVNDYDEQPNVLFKYSVVFLAHGFVQQKPRTWAWATESHIRNTYENYLRAPVIRAWADGPSDSPNSWFVNLEFPLQPEEQVHAVQAALLFDFSFDGPAALSMDGLAYIDHSSAVPGSALSVEGEAHLRQRKPLSVRRGNVEVGLRFDQDASSSLKSMVSAYAKRNFTMGLQNEYKIWDAASTRDSFGEFTNKFNFNFTLHIPRTQVRYVPDLAEVLKVAWMQYLSIAALFYVMFQVLQNFVYSNQVLETIVASEGTMPHSKRVKVHRF